MDEIRQEEEHNQESEEDINKEHILDSSENINEEEQSSIIEYTSDEVKVKRHDYTETIRILNKLTKVDSELAEIEEEKGDLPSTISKLRQEILDLEFVIGGDDAVINNLNTEEKELTEQNSDGEARIEKYDNEKYSVKSNKEYDKIMLTIDAMYEQIEKNEERLKAIKTEREEIQKRVDENNLKLGELQKDLGEYEKQLEELNKEHEEEERDLMLQRNENLSKLDDETKNLYEKINGTFAGEATAIVRKGNCSGCFNVIPPQRVIEIRQAEDIYTCQSCGRILIDESIVNS